MKTFSLQRRLAFTLTEMLVVMAIIAFMGSLIMGGFNSFVGGQRRTTCTTNLAQIYRAAKLYSDDNRGFPPYNATTATGGLWLTWASRDTNNASGDGILAPEVTGLPGYLRTPEVLHCPADARQGTTGLPSPQSLYRSETFTVNNVPYARINRDYLSYQLLDESVPTGTAAQRQTYWPTRQKLTAPLNASTVVPANFSRQLLPVIEWTGMARPDQRADVDPLGSTIVTWCQFHRGVNPTGKSDNVLFYDGSVRRLTRLQPNCGTDLWMRAPNDCNPSATPGPKPNP